MTTIQLPDTTTDSQNDIKVEEIPPYKIIFLNDDVTTMEFVVNVLARIFKKDNKTAMRLMLEVHHKGSAVVDILSLEQAEFRQEQTHLSARKAGYPLRCIIERA